MKIEQSKGGLTPFTQKIRLEDGPSRFDQWVIAVDEQISIPHDHFLENSLMWLASINFASKSTCWLWLATGEAVFPIVLAVIVLFLLINLGLALILGVSKKALIIYRLGLVLVGLALGVLI